MKLEVFQQIFEKCSNMKYNENPSSGSRVVPCEWADGQMKHRQAGRQTDMTKPFTIFRMHLDRNIRTAINKVHGEN